MGKATRSLLLAAILIVGGEAAIAQLPTAPPGPQVLPKSPDPVERLSSTQVRVGNIRVDTARHEARIPGKVNPTDILEFIANTNNGFRAYESAFDLETNGLTFNLAMILIGLDKAGSVAPRFHFDPNAPSGDLVEVWVEWKAGSRTRRMRAEEMLWDKEKKQKFAKKPWVYTGSTVTDDGRYMADVDAVLIGFVHDPSSIIEWTGPNGLGRFGFIQLDPKLGLRPGSPVTVIVKAIATRQKD